MPTVHERDEWLAGYKVASGESSAWWGGTTWPGDQTITNITWHYPGGTVTNNAGPIGRFVAELQSEQAAYHRRRDGGATGRPSPFDQGYDLGYNAMIDATGGIWKIRWTDKRCAANGSTAANGVSFAVQFMTVNVDDDLTDAQLVSARWLDGWARDRFPNIPASVAGHKCHSDWFSTACPGDVIRPRVRAGDLLEQAAPPAPVLSEVDMPLYRIAFGAPQIIPDGSIFEIVAGAKRHVSETEWVRVIKGVAADKNGTVPPPAPGQPIAYLADPWGLNVLPDYAAGSSIGIAYDEAFAQAVIGAVDRLLSDESLFFKRA